MAYTLHNATIASTYDRLFTRNTTVPSTGTTTTGIVAMNDSGVDIALPLYISTERIGIGTSAPAVALEIDGNANTNTTVELLRLSSNQGQAQGGGLAFSVRRDDDGGSQVNSHIQSMKNDDSDSGQILGLNPAGGNVGIGTLEPNLASASSGNRVLTIQGSAQNKIGILELVTPDVTSTGNIGGITFINLDDGSSAASTSAIYAVRDEDDDTASRIAFYTEAASAASTEKMTILGSGNVGIGTTSPISAFEVEAGLTTTGAVISLGTKEPTVVANDVLGRINFYAPLDTGTDSDEIGASIAAIAQDTFSNSVNSTALVFQTGKSEVATTKMVIDEDGFVGIGNTAPGYGLVYGDASTSSPTFQIIANDTTTSEILFTEEATNRFGIRMHAASDDIQIHDYVAGATAASISTGDGDWQAGSDLRIKKDIENIDSCLSKINALRPITWKRKYGALDRTYAGLVAQEVLPHFPLVVGSADRPFVEIPAKDAVKDENEKIIEEATTLTYSGGMTIGYSSFVPYLIKAIQELSAKVTALENA